MNKTLTFVFSVIIILLCIASGFLAWQNQQLVKQIRQALPTPTPQATPIPTPTSTPDAHANWKDYELSSFKLSFKAPLEVNVKIDGGQITFQDYPIGAPPPDNYYKAVVTLSGQEVTDTETLKGDKNLTEQIISTFVWED